MGMNTGRQSWKWLQLYDSLHKEALAAVGAYPGALSPFSHSVVPLALDLRRRIRTWLCIAFHRFFASAIMEVSVLHVVRQSFGKILHGCTHRLALRQDKVSKGAPAKGSNEGLSRANLQANIECHGKPIKSPKS